MAKYRKRPVVVDAWPFDGTEVCAQGFMARFPDVPMFYAPASRRLYLETLEGPLAANAGDMIIRGVSGELYPCKPDIFVAAYAPIAERGV